MASRAKAALKEKKDDGAPEKDAPDTPDAPLPLLDLSDAAVRKMIKAAKKRGYVTHEQINAVLPSEEVTSDQIEDVFAMLNEMGINVVETEEAEAEEAAGEEAREEPEEEESDGELVEVPRSTPAETKKSEPGERTDDPVRMYLREMGSVELLSREGEIAIAKRIEAGREAMIAGLCESPLTFQAIIIWRDELNDGKVFLRDIIDLEATYAGPDAKDAPVDPRRRPTAAPAAGGRAAGRRQTVAPATAPAAATPFRAKPEPMRGEEEAAVERAGGRARRGRSRRLDVARRDRGRAQAEGAGDLRQRRRRLQAAAPPAGPGHPAQAQERRRCRRHQERKYKKLKEEIIAEVKSLRLNQARIDSLVEQLYDINKRLVGYEGRLMRLAESHGVAREDFLKNYQGSELDPRWLNRVSKLSAARLEEPRRPRQGRASRSCAPRSTRSPTRPASRSRNSARSSRWCRRASARRARPRRRWWRRTCASSSRSPRNTPTAACSSST